jgi:hypothetical protein
MFLAAGCAELWILLCSLSGQRRLSKPHAVRSVAGRKTMSIPAAQSRCAGCLVRSARGLRAGILRAKRHRAIATVRAIVFPRRCVFTRPAVRTKHRQNWHLRVFHQSLGRMLGRRKLRHRVSRHSRSPRVAVVPSPTAVDPRKSTKAFRRISHRSGRLKCCLQN